MKDIIKFLKTDDFSYIKVNKINKYKNKIAIYEKGLESKMNLSYNNLHPTGIIINTNYLRMLNINEYNSYEKVAFYPHFFIKYDICKYGKTVEYNSNFWKYAEKEFITKNRSGYLLEKKIVWFEPQEILNILCKYTIKIITDQNLNNKGKRKC